MHKLQDMIETVLVEALKGFANENPASCPAGFGRIGSIFRKNEEPPPATQRGRTPGLRRSDRFFFRRSVTH